MPHAKRLVAEPLERRRLLASAGMLLQYDFNAGTAWSQAGATTSANVVASAAQSAVGTIDVAGSTARTNGMNFDVSAAPSSGAWRANFTSGKLALANAESNLGKLTLAFNLSASQARAIRVRVVSYDAAGNRTGARETDVLPPAADAFQRVAIDLSTMSASGTGTFVPTTPFVSFDFEVRSGDGWSASAARTLRVDNVNYSKPAYYVKPASSGGSNNADGKTEATAFATPAKAVSVARAGDVIDVMNGTYAITSAGANAIDFSYGGTPAAWITLKNYPGQSPLITNEWWNAINVGNGSSASKATTAAVAYIEVRGLHVRGNADTINKTNPELLGATDPRTNNSGLTVDGRYETNRPHDVRFADNVVELCSGAGIGILEGDRIQIEGNVVRNTSWWTKYATSGISILSAYSFDATSNLYTRVVRNNVSSGNQTFVKWAEKNAFSDGNGIIIDYNHNSPDLPTAVVNDRTLVLNNVAFNNGGSGIHAYQSAHVDIVGNTAYLNSASPELEYPEIFANTASDVRIFNNILVAPVADTANGERAEKVNGNTNSTNVVYNNNLYLGGNVAPIMGSGDAIGDPKFVLASRDAAVADFRLQATSPAINKGGASALVPARDALNNPRNGVSDIGAYEYYVAAPTIVTAAVSDPPTPTSAALDVLAGDDDGTAALTYTWSVTSKPGGAPDPTFDQNGTVAARRAVATFARAGAYALLVTVRDAGGLTATSTVNVTIAPTLSGLTLTPANASVPAGTTRQYVASGVDQFGQPMSAGSVAWSTTNGNAIDANGLFTASSTPNAFGVTATGGAFGATVNGNVVDVTAPTLNAAASRKTHGSAGAFDVALDLASTAGTVEPRKNGPTTLVFTFGEPVAALDGTLDANDFAIANGTFAEATTSGNTLTLSLAGVVDQTRVVVSLDGIGDRAGNAIAGDRDVAVRALLGDVNGSGRVDIFDQQAVKNALLQPVSIANFLFDVDASGGINIFDQQIVKDTLLHALA